MKPRFSPEFLAGALTPQARFGTLIPTDAIETDTRALTPGSAFLSLRGERFDGHAFLAAALEAGAKGLIVDREEGVAELIAAHPGAWAVVVDNTTRALARLARAWRLAVAPRVLAITGSNGKTTTKELAAAILGSQAPTLKTEGNLNNQIGVPLTLLRLRDERFAVIEMGMNHLGEIAELAADAVPDVGLITNVGAAHLEGLGTIENVAEAKGELWRALDERAVAVVNADDPRLVAQAARTRARLVRFSLHDPTADVYAVNVAPAQAGYAVRVRAYGAEADFALPLWGRHNAANLLGAVAACLALGVPLASMPDAVARCEVPGYRARVNRGDYPSLTVIEDCYNANPASMRAALELLVQLSAPETAVALLGEMRELGETSPRLHEELGEEAARVGVRRLVAFGPHAEDVVRGARRANPRLTAEAETDDETRLEELVRGMLRPGDTVLVKGSRGIRMERLFPCLKARFAE